MEPSTVSAAGKASRLYPHLLSPTPCPESAGWRRHQNRKAGRGSNREDKEKTVIEHRCLYVLDLCFKTKTENWYIYKDGGILSDLKSKVKNTLCQYIKNKI